MTGKRGNRDSSGKFLPGTSGNPAGRAPEPVEVKELARQHTTTAMNALVEIVSDPKKPPAARVAAASVILDRGWGKATQPIDAKLDRTTQTISDIIDSLDSRGAFALLPLAERTKSER